MKGRKPNKRRKGLFCLLFAVLMSVLFINPTESSAAAQKVNPNDTRFANKNNSLLFATDAAHANSLRSVTSSNPALKVIEETSSGRKHKVIYWDNLNDLKKTDTITITYDKVGYYAGRDIKAQMVLSDFTIGQNYFGVSVAGKNNYLHINYDLPQGFTTSGIRRFTTQLKLTYADNGQAVNLQGDSYISISSLNGHKELASGLGDVREFVSYNSMSSLPYYLTNTTAIGEYTDPISGSGTVVGGITNPETDKNFVDAVGAPTFTNATVSFQVQGTNLRFTMGATYGSQWVAFNASTLWNVKPANPTKKVTNSAGVDYNGKRVGVGETLIYHVTQKTNTLNQDLLTKYSKFEISDPLPIEVDYVSARVETSGNSNFQASGEIKYDANSRTVTYSANTNTMQNRMRYVGEDYTLVITTKVNDKTKEGVQIKDTGRSIVNSNGANTNTVVNDPPILPSISKKIVQNGKEIDRADVNYDDWFGYKVNVTLPNPSSDKSFIVTDDLEDILDVDGSSVKVFDASTKKDITSEGTLSVDNTNEKWSWTVANNSSSLGRKIYVTFNAKVKLDFPNADKYLDADKNIVIPNKATLNTLTSNEVVVVPKVPDIPKVLPRTGSNHQLIIQVVAVVAFGLVVLLFFATRKFKSKKNV